MSTDSPDWAAQEAERLVRVWPVDTIAFIRSKVAQALRDADQRGYERGAARIAELEQERNTIRAAFAPWTVYEREGERWLGLVRDHRRPPSSDEWDTLVQALLLLAQTEAEVANK